MGFLKDLGSAAIGGVKDWTSEANDYYEKAMDMDDERLSKELQRARYGSNKAKLFGYNKAAQERNIR